MGAHKASPGHRVYYCKSGDLTWVYKEGDFLVSVMSKKKRKISFIIITFQRIVPMDKFVNL